MLWVKSFRTSMRSLAIAVHLPVSGGSLTPFVQLHFMQRKGQRNRKRLPNEKKMQKPRVEQGKTYYANHTE